MSCRSKIRCGESPFEFLKVRIHPLLWACPHHSTSMLVDPVYPWTTSRPRRQVTSSLPTHQRCASPKGAHWSGPQRKGPEASLLVSSPPWLLGASSQLWSFKHVWNSRKKYNRINQFWLDGDQFKVCMLVIPFPQPQKNSWNVHNSIYIDLSSIQGRATYNQGFRVVLIAGEGGNRMNLLKTLSLQARTAGEHPGIRALISGHQHSVPTTSFKPDPRGWRLSANNRYIFYFEQHITRTGGSSKFPATWIATIKKSAHTAEGRWRRAYWGANSHTKCSITFGRLPAMEKRTKMKKTL